MQYLPVNSNNKFTPSSRVLQDLIRYLKLSLVWSPISTFIGLNKDTLNLELETVIKERIYYPLFRMFILKIWSLFSSCSWDEFHIPERLYQMQEHT